MGHRIIVSISGSLLYSSRTSPSAASTLSSRIALSSSILLSSRIALPSSSLLSSRISFSDRRKYRQRHAQKTHNIRIATNVSLMINGDNTLPRCPLMPEFLVVVGAADIDGVSVGDLVGAFDEFIVGDLVCAFECAFSLLGNVGCVTCVVRDLKRYHLDVFPAVNTI